MIIENGVGDATKAKVNERNELDVFAVTETEAQAAAELGDAYNINTGEETFAASTSSGLLYFKNDEDTDVIIESIALGFKNSTTTDDLLAVYVVRNPTGGTLVDATSNVDMNQNRNFGSSKTLKTTTLAYKSTAQNQTLTGGNDIILLHASKAGRLYAEINLEIPRGSAIGIRVDSASLATTCYAALILHVKDAKRIIN
jgi:hypothetical protein